MAHATLFKSYLLGDHAELLKIDHPVDFAVVAEVDKGEVLLDDGPEGDDGWLHVLRVDEVPVARHVSARVHQLLHLLEQPQVFAGKLLPGGLQPCDGSMTEAGDDRKHRVEILRLFALTRYLDELLDASHPLVNVGLCHDL